MKHVYLIFIKGLLIYFLFFSQSVLAQKVKVNFDKKDKTSLENIRNSGIDLNGHWEGNITQGHWAGKPEFENPADMFKVELKQRGNTVTGKFICNARFSNNMGSLYYEKEFTGVFDGKTLHYKDIKVTDYMCTYKGGRRLETCMKESDLDFFIKDGNYYLEGAWKGYGHQSGTSCTPGEIMLKKVNPDKEENKPVTFAVNYIAKRLQDVVIKRQIVKKIKGRKIREGKKTTVKSQYITLEVFDHKRNDGDIISLYYNGRWILKSHKLDKNKHIVDVFIQNDRTQPNYLILYAHNLGEVPPNTAAIIVDDGQNRQQFVLNANLRESDIIYFELEE